MGFDAEKQIITDVELLYTRVQQPAYIMDAEIKAEKFKVDKETLKEFVLDISMDKETYKAIKKMKFNRTINNLDNEEFEEKYKTKSTYEDRDTHYVMKLATSAFIPKKTVDPITKEVTVERVAVEYESNIRPKLWDIEGNDITMDVLVGNGSKGDVHFSTAEYQRGTSAFLRNILVKELIHYEAPNKEEDETKENETANPFGKAKKEAPAKKVATPKKVEAKKEEALGEDDGCPFV